MEPNRGQVKNDPPALNIWWRLYMLRNTLGFRQAADSRMRDIFPPSATAFAGPEDPVPSRRPPESFWVDAGLESRILIRLLGLRPDNPELMHPRSQGARVDAQNYGGPVLAFEAPAGFGKDFKNLVSLGLFQGFHAR